jgi:hypothetical protein
MAPLREKIVSRALELIRSNPNGLRYSDLIRQLKEGFPNTPHGTIAGSVWNLDIKKPDKVYKAARGLFRHISFREPEVIEKEIEFPTKMPIKEENFYKPFAEFNYCIWSIMFV